MKDWLKRQSIINKIAIFIVALGITTLIAGKLTPAGTDAANGIQSSWIIVTIAAAIYAEVLFRRKK